MATFTFNTRETYIAYRQDWKVRYKAQADVIRNLKKNISFAYKAGDQDRASNLQGQLVYERREANALMMELMAAKEFKNEQLAAHAAVAA